MKIILIICTLFFSTLTVHASDTIVIGEKFVIKSGILGEDRPYIVGLPESYNDKTYQLRHYPVIYILDGDIHFHAATGVINHMSSLKNNGNIRIPEMIVVAIPNTKDRLHDLTPNNSSFGLDGKDTGKETTSGGGVKFLQFIEKEIIPEIEKNFRTIPHRTFVGHSLGGLTVLYSLITQPGLFQNYIAIDSSLWWDNKIMNKWVQKFVANDQETKARIFMSVADHKMTGSFPAFIGMTASNMFFSETLQESQSPDLKVKLQIFPGQDHGSVPLLSLYHGLMYVFDGHKPAMKTLTEGAEALSAHYKSFSKSAGAEFLPPEGLVDLLASVFAKPLNLTIEKMQSYFELNVENYPKSAHAKRSLAKFLKKKNTSKK